MARLEASEREARESFPLIFGDENPFKFEGVLDVRDERPPSVIHVRYFPDSGKELVGLGEWGDQQNLLVSPGSWVEEPTIGQDLAIKLRITRNRSVNRELYANLIGNQLFAPDEAARTPRLFGFGTGGKYSRYIFSTDVQKFITVEEPDHYLVFEYIEQSFQELGKNEAFKNGLPPEQAIGLGLLITGFLQKLHSAGIVHGDLEGPGLDEHVFWDQASNRIRVIDLEGGKISLLDKDWEKLLFMDQESIGNLLVRGLFGDGIDWSHYEDEIRKIFSIHPEISSQLLRIIKMCKGVNQAWEKTEMYPHNAAGTGQIYEDLMEVKELLSAAK